MATAHKMQWARPLSATICSVRYRSLISISPMVSPISCDGIGNNSLFLIIMIYVNSHYFKIK
jgi:hypothetical protein